MVSDFEPGTNFTKAHIFNQHAKAHLDSFPLNQSMEKRPSQQSDLLKYLDLLILSQKRHKRISMTSLRHQRLLVAMLALELQSQDSHISLPHKVQCPSEGYSLPDTMLLLTSAALPHLLKANLGLVRVQTQVPWKRLDSRVASQGRGRKKTRYRGALASICTVSLSWRCLGTVLVSSGP